MKVVFRCDASLHMGTGHVMRCLTLADELRDRGAQCHFISREHPGHLIGLIQTKGHALHVLPLDEAPTPPEDGEPDSLSHRDWLGCSQAHDTHLCEAYLHGLEPDWLVVDHYALDARWENAMRRHCRRVMVIDDLADRRHDSDLLLDQTLGRDPAAYANLVPKGCMMVCGSSFALLRPEFANMRPHSLQRRSGIDQIRHLLITLGGVDRENVTCDILTHLSASELPPECRITIVMGQSAPWLDLVRQTAMAMPWPVTVLAGAHNMAELMADSDLAIGAAGSTSWERCCLGLPTVQVILAENQRLAAASLASAGAVIQLDQGERMRAELVNIIHELGQGRPALQDLSHCASQITDGHGAAVLADLLMRANP